MLKLKILEEAELGAKFFANIRLVLDKKELARKKPYNYIMDWPRNLKKIQGKDLEPYKKKGMEAERELPSSQYFLITRQEYKKLKKEGKGEKKAEGKPKEREEKEKEEKKGEEKPKKSNAD